MPHTCDPGQTKLLRIIAPCLHSLWSTAEPIYRRVALISVLFKASFGMSLFFKFPDSYSVYFVVPERVSRLMENAVYIS